MRMPADLLRLCVIEVVELYSLIQGCKCKGMYEAQLIEVEISVLTQGTQL